MQPSPGFDSERTVRVLRWIARVAGVVAAMGFALWVGFSFSPEPGSAPMVIEPAQWAIWGILGAGLLLTILGSIFQPKRSVH